MARLLYDFRRMDFFHSKKGSKLTKPQSVSFGKQTIVN
jgi:hypothetical protein